MLGKTVRFAPQNNIAFKLSATVALITMSLIGTTDQTPPISFKSNENQEVNLIKAKKVFIDRYEMTDQTTGSAIFVSQISPK
ncbi:hypothetical protein ACL6C3_16475 [Capilliphycus salinus ALCB114379]|uniref:hypothetical protein n=1 Tax=Capilliphycus salinus TaxID=2768948 RepID=UPI0039A53CE8